jgi:para-nitrobenzyl esterase
MFDTLAARYRDAVTPNDEAMATTFNTYVGNFVKTGDPTGEALPDWPHMVPDFYDLLNFSLEDGPVFGRTHARASNSSPARGRGIRYRAV